MKNVYLNSAAFMEKKPFVIVSMWAFLSVPKRLSEFWNLAMHCELHLQNSCFGKLQKPFSKVLNDKGKYH